MAHNFESFGLLPGIGALRETVEGAITWGPWEYSRSFIVPAVIDGASRDAGHTGQTTVLRPGLLMAIYDRDVAGKKKKVTPWVLTAQTDGSDLFYGILLFAQNMQELGADKDRWGGYVLVGGLAKSKSLLLGGDTAIGGWVEGANDAAIRAALMSGGATARGGTGRFILDDFGIFPLGT